MSSDTDSVGRNVLDTSLLFLTVAIVGASLAGFYYFEEFNDLVRTLGLLAGFGLATVVYLQTEQGRVVWGYIKGSRIELRRVIWPTKNETLQTTFMILLITLLLSLALWGIDSILSWSMQQIPRGG